MIIVTKVNQIFLEVMDMMKWTKSGSYYIAGKYMITKISRNEWKVIFDYKSLGYCVSLKDAKNSVEIHNRIHNK